MMSFKTGRLLPLVIGATAAFAILLFAVPPKPLVNFLNATFLGMFGAVMVAFAPLILRMWEGDKPTRVDYMVLGFVLLWLCMFMSRTLSVIVNATAPEMRDRLLPAIALTAFTGILAGVLQLYAAGSVEDRWRFNRGIVITAVIFGFIVSAASLWVQTYGFPK